MRGARAIALLTAIALVATGCVGETGIPFDRSQFRDVRTIGIISPAIPDKPSVVLATSVGQSFGLFGALIDAGLQSNREAKFIGILQQQNFSAEDALLQNIAAALAANGYMTKMVPLKREGTEFAAQYPTDADSQVDAFLDLVASSYGYVAAGIGDSAPYRPTVSLRVRLVHARTSSILMQDAVIYNPVRPPRNTITIAPDPAHGFRNFDMLVNDLMGAVKGLHVAFERSAQSIGMQLR